MANNKVGLDFYSVETDRYQNKKIKRVRKDFGCAGVAVYDFILCEIYRVKGCFLVWDSDTAFDVADYFGIKESLVNEIVNYCCVVGLFDKALLMRENVLSSYSIQERYLNICIKAKRKDPKIPEQYRIIQEESNIIPEQCIDNSDILPQSKLKESKDIDTKVSIPTSVGETQTSNSYKSIEKTKTGIWDYLKTGPKEIEPYVDFWNLFAAEKGVPRVRDITKKRRQKLKVRLSEKAFDFCNILRMAGNSEFLLSHGWFAFDWIIENESNYFKMLEGNYQSKPPINAKDDEIRRKAAEHAQLAERQRQKLREG